MEPPDRFCHELLALLDEAELRCVIEDMPPEHHDSGER